MDIIWSSPFYRGGAATAAKSLQLCPTLCDPIDGSPPGSPVPGILQARTLEWVAISFSSVWMWKVKVKSLSRVWLLATPWTVAHQVPPSMGFSRQEYWSGVPSSSLHLRESRPFGNFPNVVEWCWVAVISLSGIAGWFQSVFTSVAFALYYFYYSSQIAGHLVFKQSLYISVLQQFLLKWLCIQTVV